MNNIQLCGQVISCVNYASDRLFNFTPEPLRQAAEHFLAAGITGIEIPQAVLDPEGRFPETGLDKEILEQTISMLPKETKVIGSYVASQFLGMDNQAYLKSLGSVLNYLVEYFPHLSYVMLHPAKKEFDGKDNILKIVDTYARLAEHAASLKQDLQLCFHNHYDGNGESAEQVRTYLDGIKEINSPNLRWGPDTGHCHGMGSELLDVFDEYASLIGDFFHIKARIPAFDQLHGGSEYKADRDIWSNKAEIGTGLYSGFVNVADPEIQTPLKEIFKRIRGKALPSKGIVYGAMEIDIPRQHPRLEVLCGTLYLKNVHGIKTGLELSNDQIIERIFCK